jgi:DNA repair protein RadC
MYQSTATDSSSRRPVTRPSWLRLVREPLSAAERGALAAQHGRITSSAGVVALLRGRACAEEVECFYVVALDAKLRPVAMEEVARGTLTTVTVGQREVFRLAVVVGAFAVILAHNHPSGDPSPSTEDLELTRRLVATGQVVGIPVLDHVILASGHQGGEAAFSFSDHGLFPDA